MPQESGEKGFEDQGLEVSTSGTTIEINVPGISSESHRLRIIAELYALCDIPLDASHWVINLSENDCPSQPILATLLALAQRLQRLGCSLDLPGLDAARLDPRVRAQLSPWLPEEGDAGRVNDGEP